MDPNEEGKSSTPRAPGESGTSTIPPESWSSNTPGDIEDFEFTSWPFPWNEDGLGFSGPQYSSPDTTALPDSTCEMPIFREPQYSTLNTTAFPDRTCEMPIYPEPQYSLPDPTELPQIPRLESRNERPTFPEYLGDCFDLDVLSRLNTREDIDMNMQPSFYSTPAGLSYPEGLHYSHCHSLPTNDTHLSLSLSLEELEQSILRNDEGILQTGQVNVNKTIIDDGSALCLAAKIGNPTLMGALLEVGADVNRAMTSGENGSALAAACLGDHSRDINIRFLIQNGADVNMELVCGLYGSALVAACHRSSVYIVEYLLRHGAEVNMVLKNGEFPTSLMAALRAGKPQIVRTLLNYGANPNLPIPTGSFGDAISLAISLTDKLSVSNLIEAGAHIGPLASDLINTGKLVITDKSYHAFTHASSLSSRRLPSSFIFYCELPELAIECHDLPSWLFNARVLTRKKKTIGYSSVGQFLCETYGLLARKFLDNLVRAFESNEHFYVDGTMSLRISPKEIQLKCCSLDKELPSMFEWLCCVIRRQESGLIRLSTAYKEQTPDCLFLSQQPTQPLSTFDLTNCCWTGLFDGAVIAPGPGIKAPEPSQGLELDCNTMIQLAAVEYPVLIDSDDDCPPGLVFMGYSAALIPIRETEDGMILWHLEVASNDCQIKASELKAIQSEWLRMTDLSHLLSKRALIGWCSQAELRLGASTDDLNVTWSHAKVKPFSYAPTGINLQAHAQSAAPAQFGIQAGVSLRWVSNTIKLTQADEYLRCLNNSREQQIILYDVRTSRAWLVPLISVFHHMLLVYWKRIPEIFRERDIPLAIPTSLHPNASYEALIDKGELVIQRSNQIEHSLTVQKLIIGFAINLGRISLQKPKASEIYGYEFMDIACEKPTTTLKKTTLERDGLAWLPLLKEVDCLFCSDLGDAIVGQRTSNTPSTCNILPAGHDLLAALVRSIEQLSEMKGGCQEGHIRRLLNDSAWQPTGSPFQACQHDSHESCWNQPEFLQQITSE